MIRHLLLAATLLGPAVAGAAAGEPTGYAVTGQIAGSDGGWDYAQVDPATRRLYVAHGDTVAAFDLASDRALPSLGSIMRGHAVVPIVGQALLLVTSGRDDSVRLIDSRTGTEVAKIAVGGNPDAALYDAASGRAYVMNAKSGTVSVIDVAQRKVAATYTLKPGLEYAALARGTLFVNNEDANEIERVDVASGMVGTPIALTGCEGPSGLGYDGAGHRLISACANGKAAVVDAVGDRLIGLLDIGKGPDAVIMDAARHRALVPCGRDGTLVAIDLAAKGGAKVSGTYPTEIGARTGALDPTDGAVYLPTAKFAAPATPGGRPTAVPGSFHIVIVKPV